SMSKRRRRIAGWALVLAPSALRRAFEVRLERRGVVLLFVAAGEEQGEAAALRQRQQVADLRRVGVELGRIEPAELLPVALLAVAVVARAQVVRGRGVAQPHVKPRRLLADAARPQPVDEHARAVVARRLVVDALDADVHGAPIL